MDAQQMQEVGDAFALALSSTSGLSYYRAKIGTWILAVAVNVLPSEFLEEFVDELGEVMRS